MLFIMRPFKRRKFLASCAVVPFLGFLTSCKEESKPATISENQLLKKDPNAMALSQSMDRPHVHAMLDQRVELVMEKSHNCAQTTFFVLSEQFGLGGNEILKALTPLPGMAERGETCGAITGALMAMGLIYGRDKLDDWEKYRSSLIPTNKFCTQFQQELGSSLCCQIQERAFGKSYNLMDPDDLREFQRAGATSKCSKVVQKACRLAADIILDTAEKA
jgi:C_GCAxxG_C_C family probable redox protein